MNSENKNSKMFYFNENHNWIVCEQVCRIMICGVKHSFDQHWVEFYWFCKRHFGCRKKKCKIQFNSKAKLFLLCARWRWRNRGNSWGRCGYATTLFLFDFQSKRVKVYEGACSWCDVHLLHNFITLFAFIVDTTKMHRQLGRHKCPQLIQFLCRCNGWQPDISQCDCFIFFLSKHTTLDHFVFEPKNDVIRCVFVCGISMHFIESLYRFRFLLFCLRKETRE